MADSTPLVLTDEPIVDAKEDADQGKPGTSKSPQILMMGVNALCNIRYKSLLFLFILFILITSDVFINMILKKLNGTVDDHGYATPYGTVIQGIVLVLGFMILNFLIDQEII